MLEMTDTELLELDYHLNSPGRRMASDSSLERLRKTVADAVGKSDLTRSF